MITYEAHDAQSSNRITVRAASPEAAALKAANRWGFIHGERLDLYKLILGAKPFDTERLRHQGEFRTVFCYTDQTHQVERIGK